MGYEKGKFTSLVLTLVAFYSTSHHSRQVGHVCPSASLSLVKVVTRSFGNSMGALAYCGHLGTLVLLAARRQIVV